MKKLFLTPQFVIGLSIRLVLIFTVLPVPVQQWYAPFLQSSVDGFGLDPWGTWNAAGGDQQAFPYGYVMWAVFLPFALISKVSGLPYEYGYGLTLLIADIGVMLVLRKILAGKNSLLLWAYWLSPIVIVASYLLGFNDLVPVLLLCLALYFVKQPRVFVGAAVFAIAVSAKFSMILALPFFVIYLLHNRTLRRYFVNFLRGLAFGALFACLPTFFSPAAVSAIRNNPEVDKVFSLSLQVGSNIAIFLVPLTYMLCLYAAWRIKRLNFNLFFTILGTVFLFVVLMTPASPGWFIWAIPLLVMYQLSGDRFAISISATFSVLYLLSTLLLGASGNTVISGLDYEWMRNLVGPVDSRAVSAAQTAMFATGLVLAYRIWRYSVSRNDFFRLSRKPFAIGVAGDSGAGKDTFAEAITGLFGQPSVTSISGDDYHLWDRQKPIWQVMTHLNPMANDLERFATDVIDLTDGRSIQTRHYDHETGRMSRMQKVESNDFIIASGLHALYLPILRDSYSLSVYLDIDESVRRYFKLERDVNTRGHSAERVLESFEKRESDSARFIRPQLSHADLVLSLRPIHPQMTEGSSKGPLRFKLMARSRNGLNELSLTRTLIGVCGLHVDMDNNIETSELELTIEGETSAEDVALAAQIVCPRVLEFLDVKPDWRDGVTGIMQLITLSHINQALTKRFI